MIADEAEMSVGRLKSWMVSFSLVVVGLLELLMDIEIIGGQHDSKPILAMNTDPSLF